MAKTLLVPTDFSKGSDQAIATAIRFAKLMEASLQLVHVNVMAAYVLPPPVELVSFIPYNAEVLAYIEQRLAQQAESIRTEGVRVETATLAGNPHEEIIKRAESCGAELIVMGTHGRTGLSHALLGSVAERVVQKAGCPVLVVPPHERRAAATTR